MAYSTTNPPVLLAAGLTNDNGNKIWMYTDGDAAATVRADGYFSNASDLGMEVGDLVFHYDTGNTLINSYRVASVTAGGAADLADATVIGSATDSD